MKSCPTCNRQYVDETMKFCLDDGQLLTEQLAATRLGSDADATFYLPVPPTSPPAGKTAASPRSTMTSLGFQPASVSPGLQTPTESPAHSNRGALWVVVALIIGGSGIAIASIIMFGRRSDGASVPQPPTYVASPSPALNSESGSSTNESKGQASPGDLAQVKATPIVKATPLAKPTTTKADAKQEQPDAPPAAPRGPISGGVLNGRAIRLVTPPYPPAARAVHASGAVQVQVLVDENGNVVSASAISGHPLLRSSAVSAARASKFTPTKLSGQPVKVNGVIVYNFVEQ